MLIQQLRQMEAGGIVRRIVHHQVPPKVEYSLTNWGQALCPALDAMLKWAALREVNVPPASPGVPEAGNGDAREHDEKRVVTRRGKVTLHPVACPERDTSAFCPF